MNFENPPKNQPAESEADRKRGERIQEIAGQVRDRFFSSIKGKEFTLRKMATGVDQTVVAMGVNDPSGGSYVREKGHQTSVLAGPQTILRSREGRAMVNEMLKQENLSVADAQAVKKELGLL